MIILDAAHARLNEFMVRDAIKLMGGTMYVHPSRTENIFYTNGRFDTKVKVNEAEFRHKDKVLGKIINLEMKI